jgi:ADP-ribose pyrophosphatase YjhB (NUDIX family)
MGLSNWHDTYTGKLRKLTGTQKLLGNSVRAIICDEKGNALFIKRRGDNRWGMPVGAMELDESVYDCLKREVKEETGLDVLNASLIAIYSRPEKQSFIDSYGNEHQIIEFLFYVDEWSGVLQRETNESINANFFPIDALPEASNDFFAKHHDEIFEDFKSFSGKLILK